MSQNEIIKRSPSSNSDEPNPQLPGPSGKEIRKSQEPDIRQLLNQLSREARPAAVHQIILEFLTNAFSGSGKFLDTTKTSGIKFSAQIQLNLVNQIINISDISQAENSDQYSKYLAPGLQKAVHRFLFLRNLEQIFAASAQQAPEPQSRSDPRPMSHLQSIIDCLLSLKNLAGDETYKTWQISNDPRITVGHTIGIITQFMNSINSGNPDYRFVTQITRNLGLREAVVAVGKRQIDALQRFRTEGRTLSKEQAREWLFRLQHVAPWLTPYLQGELTEKRYDELMHLARLFFTNEQQQYVNLLPRMLNDAGLLGFDPSAKQKPSRKEPSKWFGWPREVFKPSFRKEVQRANSIEELIHLINNPKFREILNKENRDVKVVTVAIKLMRDYFVQDRRDIPIRSQSVPRNSLQVAHLRQLGITDKYGIASRVLQLLKEGRYY